MAKQASNAFLLRFFSRGIASCIEEKSLRERLRSGKRLRVKHGIDPTTAEIHLGYLGVYRKLRMLQELGHTIVLVLGEFTARFGDPTGRTESRPLRSAREVRALRKPYLSQLSHVLDLSRLEVRSNAEWYDGMRIDAFLRLLSKATVAQMLERDMFERRRLSGKEIALHELTYPVLQGYDSVMIKSDLTIVGSDQIFNELVGRHLQEAFGQRPQEILATTMLVGLDGQRKMSQSLQNTIGIREPPGEQYGKLMSLPDTALWQYFILLTDTKEATLERWKKEMKRGKRNPKHVKERLARTIVEALWGKKKAVQAAQEFTRIFQQHKLPRNLKTLTFPNGRWRVIDLMTRAGFATTASEARRLIAQKGVKVDGVLVAEPHMRVLLGDRPQLLQVGSRRFLRVRGDKKLRK